MAFLINIPLSFRQTLATALRLLPLATSLFSPNFSLSFCGGGEAGSGLHQGIVRQDTAEKAASSPLGWWWWWWWWCGGQGVSLSRLDCTG